MDQGTTMVAILLVFCALPFLMATPSQFRDRYSNLLIDCGAQNHSVTGAWYPDWQTDEEFIKSGENTRLSINHSRPQLNTLRFFPKGLKNCYNLPFCQACRYEKYMFRAEFYYGNYDGLSNPPSFQLEIDGKLWANVTASMSQEVVYHELLYILQKQDVTICLLRTNDHHVPFISSLEAFILPGYGYVGMDNSTAMYLHSRINYGANRSVEQSMDFKTEPLNRIWESKELADYLNIHAESIPDYYLSEGNLPPWQVMGHAIQAKSLTHSIHLRVDFSPRKAVQAYFFLYFKDPMDRCSYNQTCRVEIYVDGNEMAVEDVPRRGIFYDSDYRMVSLYPVAVIDGLANVTVSAAEGSTLPPLLNAMEVFSALDVSQSGCCVSLSAALFIISLPLLVVFLTPS